MTIESFTAMGSEFVAHVSERWQVSAIKEEVGLYEQQFSRFIPTSELSQLNAERHARVTENMVSVLVAARLANELTDGLVNIAIGSAVSSWGYDRPMDEITGGLQSVRRPVATPPPYWSLDDGWATLGEGTTLDLGGIAKGWTCDRIIERDMATMLSAGGDLRSSDPDLMVDITDHHDEPAASVHVGVGAIATSSVMKRTWKVAGGKAHHLIDPRTSAPAVTPMTSASVVAATAVQAEAGAKAVLLHGEHGLAWADRQPWIRQAFAIWHDGSVYATKPRKAA